MKRRLPALPAFLWIATAAMAAEPGRPESAKEFTNSLGMKFVLIPAGDFEIGSPERFPSLQPAPPAPAGAVGIPRVRYTTAPENEQPQFRVAFERPFYMAAYETTQADWEAVMDNKPWGRDVNIKQGAKYPAARIGWEQAQEFCRLLSNKEGKKYRLPTEAEWEYACRAGTKTSFCYGDDLERLSDHAWWGVSFGGNTADERYAHEVGGKKPNAWGLYDMHGNVWEWCEDIYRPRGPRKPDEPKKIATMVIRGGSWGSSANDCRSAKRGEHRPDFGNQMQGFRIVLIP